jgi:hypothetical protein
LTEYKDLLLCMIRCMKQNSFDCPNLIHKLLYTWKTGSCQITSLLSDIIYRPMFVCVCGCVCVCVCVCVLALYAADINNGQIYSAAPILHRVRISTLFTLLIYFLKPVTRSNLKTDVRTSSKLFVRFCQTAGRHVADERTCNAADPGSRTV